MFAAETFVEDASGMFGSIPFIGPGPPTSDAVETCGFGADGRGTCVFSFAGPAQSEVVLRGSGSVVPFYTLTAPTPSSSHNSAVLRSPFTAWDVLAGVVVVALFQAL